MNLTPIKVVMGGRGAHLIASEEAKASARGDTERMQAELDFSSDLNKSLYRAMYPEVNAFLRV